MKRIASVLVGAVLLSLGLCASAQPSSDVTRAVVNLSGCFVRSEPSYEAGLDTQARMGDVVEVLDEDRYWRRVATPEPYEGWTTEMAIVMMSAEELEAYESAPKFMCIAEYSHIFTNPSSDADRLCDFVMGDVVRKGGISFDGWSNVVLPDGRQGWVEAGTVQDLAEWTASRECTSDNVIALAKKFLGVPYMWGGISPKHFDCSGLTRFCFMMNGMQLPRDCSQQIKEGCEVPFDFAKMKPGDLVFFGNPDTGSPSHVGIYMGGGKMIHSSQMVRINSLKKGRPDSYEGKPVIAVRRIIN